jgi:hypothetical protein
MPQQKKDSASASTSTSTFIPMPMPMPMPTPIPRIPVSFTGSDSSNVEVEIHPPLMRSQLHLFLRKLDKTNLYSDEELTLIITKVCGDQRHAIQRLISGMHQRAYMNRKGREATRAHFLQQLFDSGKLFLAVEQDIV